MSAEKKATQATSSEGRENGKLRIHSDKVGRDPEVYLNALTDREKLQKNKVPGVRTVLVVLSSRAMVFDEESLRQKILLVYPDAAVFFRTTSGKPLGVTSPEYVDLLIDLTGPGQRQGWFYARKLRKMARFAVGRNAGLFRKRIYDRIFDEKAKKDLLPDHHLEKERFVQKHVLALAGVPFIPAGETTPDRGKVIALDLPPLNEH